MAALEVGAPQHNQLAFEIHSHLEEPIKEDLVSKLKFAGVVINNRVIIGIGDEQKINGYVSTNLDSFGQISSSTPVLIEHFGISKDAIGGCHFRRYCLPKDLCDEFVTLENYTQTDLQTYSFDGGDEGFKGFSQLLRLLYMYPEIWQLSYESAAEIVNIDPSTHLREKNHEHLSEGYWNEPTNV